MSVGPDPHIDVSQIEQARKQINRLAEEIAHLSEMDLAPAEYYGEYLQRLLHALAAPAGAVWLRTPQGNLQLQYQINMRQVGLDSTETSRQSHDELLRQAAMKGQPGLIPPHSGAAGPGEGPGPGNPTDFVILLAPIMVEKQVAGLVEIWQDAHRGHDAQRGFLNFMVRMAGLASGYTRNHQLRQMVGQQQVWTQLETFARQIHASLNPTEVSYLIANEGRRLVEADRVSVALRLGPKPQVQAISGADVVEKRSNLVQLMRKLFEAVMIWGERLVYSGTKDDTLPPRVIKALDAYLAESNSKLMVILPLRDDREAESKKPPRSALMMESFEPAAAPDQMVARLEVVARHAASALYNAAEHKRIPMRFLWMPLAKLQDGLGGKAKAIWTIIGVAFLVFVLAMVFVPYPLKMEANGTMLPIQRAWLFPPAPGFVEDIKPNLKSGTRVFKDEELIRMFDDGLAKQVGELQLQIQNAHSKIQTLKRQQTTDRDRNAVTSEIEEATHTIAVRSQQLAALRERHKASLERPGQFMLRSPMSGIVLTSDFRETLKGRPVKPNEPLLRIGVADLKNPKLSDWEAEVKIPQKHIGQVLRAFDYPDAAEKGELWVDLLLVSYPTRTFKGKLARDKISPEAKPHQDEHGESEPVVVAWVRVHGNDIPEEYRIPPELLRTAGTEVRARVRCGNHAMGYSLFYGVWEFIYEKIVFFF